MASKAKPKKGIRNLRDIQRDQAKAAMPEVKNLVRKFGRLAIGNCLAKLKVHEKELRRLEGLKREVAKLERDLG